MESRPPPPATNSRGKLKSVFREIVLSTKLLTLYPFTYRTNSQRFFTYAMTVKQMFLVRINKFLFYYVYSMYTVNTKVKTLKFGKTKLSCKLSV